MLTMSQQFLGVYNSTTDQRVSGGSSICQRGGDHGERAERKPKRGSGGGAPSGVQGQTRGRSLPEAESFLYIFTQKWPKVKDFSENLPPCLSRAAMASPKFWSMGGGP